MRRGWSWHVGLGSELGYVFWGMFFLEAAFGAYMSVWPLWIEALGAPVNVVGFILGVSGLLRLVALAPSAALAERFDTRRLILVARSVAGIGMISAAVATHWTHLIVMVVGSAAGELFFPLIQTHVAARSAADRVRAVTLVINVGPAIALAASPVVSYFMVKWWGMRAAFVLGAILTAASIALFSRIASGHDVRLHSRPKTSYLQAWARPATRRLLLLQFVTLFALALGIMFVPIFLKDERALQPATITLLGSVWAIGAAGFGIVVARVTRLQRAPCVGMAIAVGFVGLSLAALIVVQPLWLITLVMLGRGGFFSAWSLFIAALGDVVEEPLRARTFALSEMCGGTAVALAPMLAGLMYTRQPIWPLLAASVLAALLIPVLLGTQRFVNSHRVSGAFVQTDPEPG